METAGWALVCQDFRMDYAYPFAVPDFDVCTVEERSAAVAEDAFHIPLKVAAVVR